MAIMTGCAQKVLRPSINEATIRLLNRHGVEVVHARGTECCGALAHHMGKEDAGRRAAKANIEAWMREYNRGGLDAIVVNASGCGNHGEGLWPHVLKRSGPRGKSGEDFGARQGYRRGRDGTWPEGYIQGTPPRGNLSFRLFHAAWPTVENRTQNAFDPGGSKISSVKEEHLCCGSAGTYNIMQPEIANRLRDRKVANLKAAGGEVVATGNIGCLTQLGPAIDIPVIHTVELLDWATGGPKPDGL